MWWARVLIFGIPLTALSVGSWAAWQAHMVRQPRLDEVTVMLPGTIPALHPFQPADEAERQLLDLLHEPLLRLGRDGRPSPALAEQWQWHRTVTCWFGSPEQARQAAQRLQALSGNPWVAAQLEAASAEADAVTMRFVRPDDPGAEEALRSVGDLKPLQLTLIQVRVDPRRHALLRKFALENPAVVKRLWFDGYDSFELVTTLARAPFQQTLGDWLQKQQEPPMAVRTLGELTGLVEPVLEFRLRPQARWHDGAPVTAQDVRATVDWLLAHPQAAAPVGAGLQQVQRVEAAGTDRVRISYRTHVGAALAAWIDLPILPAAWLQDQTEPWATPPPGAGPFAVETRAPGSMTFSGTGGAVRRLRFIASAPALQTRAALAAETLDVIWPNQNNEPVLRNDKALDFEATPARNRLLVLWNSRSPVLADLRVRQALALATDRRALVADLLEGRGRLVEGVFPPGTWLNQKLSAAAPDLAQAEKLLAEAGWFRDVSGVARSAQRALDIQFLITEGNPWRRRLAEALARQWTRIGARVTVTDVNAHEWIGERLRPGRFDAALLGMDFDLHWDQRLFWHSAGIEDGMNFAGIADAQLDLLLEALAAEYDPSRVAARAREMESRLLSLHAFIPLFSDLQQVAIRRRRFPDPPQNPAGLRLRDWLRQGPAQPSAPVEFQMIMPDE